MKKTEWTLATDGVPDISPEYKNLSADVYINFGDGSLGIGYFNHQNFTWYNHESKMYQAGDVVAWHSM